MAEQTIVLATGQRERLASGGALFRTLRVLSRDKALLLGCCMCLFLVLFMTLGPFASGVDPQKTSANVLAAPSAQHLLGTDSLGRDLLARIVVGARWSLLVAVAGTVISLLVGVTLGIVAGYFGGWIEWVQMRLVDITLSVPPLLLAIAVLAAIGPSISSLILVLVFTHLPQTIRLLRAATLQTKQRAYVDSARISGVRPVLVMWEHILPNVRSVVIVQASVMVAHMLLVETILSFLGLGVQPPTPSLGFMVAEGRQWMEYYPTRHP